MAKNCIEIEGQVVENLSNGNFKVELDNGIQIICNVSGKMRINNIRILVGDKVKVDVSPYDVTRGRISRRMK